MRTVHKQCSAGVQLARHRQTAWATWQVAQQSAQPHSCLEQGCYLHSVRAISAAGPFSALISLYLRAAETHSVQNNPTSKWQEPCWDATTFQWRALAKFPSVIAAPRQATAKLIAHELKRDVPLLQQADQATSLIAAPPV